MNDVGEAVERIGLPFEPPEPGLGELSARAQRKRRRGRIAAGGLALLVAAGGTLLTVRAFLETSPTPRPKIGPGDTRPFTATGECPGPPADGSPLVAFSSTSGAAGSSVVVSGAFQTGERWLQVWWNADEESTPSWVAPPPWPPTGPDLRFDPVAPGSAIEVASVAGPGPDPDCSFRTTFAIPDVPPGTYQVLRVSGSVTAGQHGYALFTSPVTFEVIG